MIELHCFNIRFFTKEGCFFTFYNFSEVFIFISNSIILVQKNLLWFAYCFCRYFSKNNYYVFVLLFKLLVFNNFNCLRVLLRFVDCFCRYFSNTCYMQLFYYFTQRRTLESDTPFYNWKLFKNYEKCLLYLKSSFRYQDILIFVLIFWSSIKTFWLEKSG